MKTYRMLLLLAALMGGLVLHAQYTVSGRYVDGQGKALPGVNVSLLAADSSLLTGTVSDPEGRFVLGKVASGDYLLRGSMVGYGALCLPLKVSGDVETGDLTMVEGVALDGITVESVVRRSYANRDELQLTQYLIETSTDAVDAISKLPKFRTNEKGELGARDESVLLIVIDGQVADSRKLQLIRPENIMKIIHYTTPPLRYRDTGANSVVEVITKRQTHRSYDGNLQGYTSLHTIQPYLKGGFMYGDSLNRFTVMAGMQYMYDKSVVSENTYSYRQEGGNWLENNYTTPAMRQLQLPVQTAFDYSRIGKRYVFTTSFGYSYTQNKQYASQQVSVYDGVGTQWGGTGYDSVANVLHDGWIDLYFAYKFPHDQQLLLNMRGTYQDTWQDNYQIRQMDNPVLGMDYNDRSQIDSRSYSLIAEAGYYGRLWGGEWSVGAKFMYKQTDQIYNKMSPFNIRQYTGQLYGEYSKAWDKLSLTAGLYLHNITQNNTDTVYNFFTPRPSINMKYNFNAITALGVSASIETRNPAISELTHSITQKDRWFYMRGNPLLKPYRRYCFKIDQDVKSKDGSFYFNWYDFYGYSDNYHYPVFVKEKWYLLSADRCGS